MVRAHRLAYCVANGLELSDISGLVVLHSCDNPPCINPAHLSVGTQLDNAKDRMRRDRSAKTQPALRVVSDDEVAEIRRTYIPRHPEYSGAALARRYGIGTTQISRIVRGQSR